MTRDPFWAALAVCGIGVSAVGLYGLVTDGSLTPIERMIVVIVGVIVLGVSRVYWRWSEEHK